MIRVGLCSSACITRNAKEIIAVAAASGLDAIEWAQDVHIGSGDLGVAEELMITTLTAGLTTASYSTLYRAGAADEGYRRFDALLAVASVLQAPILRVYTGCERHSGADGRRRSDLLAQLDRLGDRAALKGITLCLSMGRGTGFSNYGFALSLVTEAKHPFVRLAWEDLPEASSAEASVALERAKNEAGIIIARQADRDGRPRTIAADLEAWRSRLASFKSAETDTRLGRFVLLGAQRAEGEAGSDSLAADAAALHSLLAELEPRKKR